MRLILGKECNQNYHIEEHESSHFAEANNNTPSVDAIWEDMRRSGFKEKSVLEIIRQLNRQEKNIELEKLHTPSISHLDSLGNKCYLKESVPNTRAENTANFTSNNEAGISYQTQGAKNYSKGYNPLEEIEIVSYNWFDGSECGAKYKNFSIGDSDDESQDEENGSISNHGFGDEAPLPESIETFCLPEEAVCGSASRTRIWTICRFVSVMQSDEDSAESVNKFEALCAMRCRLKQLCSKMTCPPFLEFEKPFAIESIVVTQNHASTGQPTVSDLPRPEFAPHWAPWQRSHFSLMDQFITKNHEEGQKRDTTATFDDKSQENFSRELQLLVDGGAIFLCKILNERLSSEKSRSLVFECLSFILLYTRDLTKVLPFIMSSIFSCLVLGNFDDNMNVFYTSASQHDFFKRGGASQRQDLSAIAARERSVTVLEQNEGNRLALCKCLGDLLRGYFARNSAESLAPYFFYLILSLQSMLSDPCSDVKLESMSLLVQICRDPAWEDSMVIFGTALAREALPLLRHRHSKVRIAALEFFEAAVSIPNRGKLKGAGTEAIADLIGFREENVSLNFLRLMFCVD